MRLPDLRHEPLEKEAEGGAGMSVKQRIIHDSIEIWTCTRCGGNYLTLEDYNATVDCGRGRCSTRGDVDGNN